MIYRNIKLSDPEDQTDVDANNSQQEDRSKVNLINRIFSRKVLLILLLISLLASRSIPGRVTEQNNLDIEQIDEYGVLTNSNDHPSKHQSQSVLAREKYWDQVARTENTLSDPTNDLFIIAISIAAADIQRRHVIRAHQIDRYKNYTNVKWKFFIGNPPFLYRDVIKFENETFGDIIILQDLQDSRKVEQSIKAFEIFKYVEKHMSVYKYVAKMDSNEFVDVARLEKEFLTQDILNLDYALIGIFLQGNNFAWPRTCFQAISWKLMLFINRIYETVRRTTVHGDMQLAWYLYDAGVNYTKIHIDEKFYRISKRNWGLTVLPDTIFTEMLDNDESEYLLAAKCFTPNGVNTTMIDLFTKNKWHIT